MKLWIVISSIGLALIGCERTTSESPPNMPEVMKPATAEKRWYTQAQVDAGKPLYLENCAACHQSDASGTKNWRTRLADGSLPPPPLNGTAHTWHHPLKILRYQIKAGGQAVGGVMPPFGKKLNSQQIDAVIAWVQSNWPDEIYQHWVKIDARRRSQ